MRACWGEGARWSHFGAVHRQLLLLMAAADLQICRRLPGVRLAWVPNMRRPWPAGVGAGGGGVAGGVCAAPVLAPSPPPVLSVSTQRSLIKRTPFEGPNPGPNIPSCWEMVKPSTTGFI